MKAKGQKVDKLSLVVTPEIVVKEFAAIKALMSQLEGRKHSLQPILEKHLRGLPDESGIIGEWLVTLVHGENESFSLKDAKAKLDNRILRPYITTTPFTYPKLTYKGSGLKAG